MRKEFGKVLRESFSRQMKSVAPEYTEVKVESQYIWPGERAFRKTMDEQLSCWVVLSPNPKGYDEFTLMLGWSNFGRYPELSAIPSLLSPTPDHSEFAEKEYLIRLPELWSGKDWWVIKKPVVTSSVLQLQASIAPVSPKAAVDLVLPQVEAAISKLVDIGIPYLNNYIDSKQRKDH